MTITTCKDCQKRHRACWGSCPEYQDARKDLEAKKEEKNKEYLNNLALNQTQYYGLKKKRR